MSLISRLFLLLLIIIERCGFLLLFFLDFRICDKNGPCCSIPSCLESTIVARLCSRWVKYRHRIQLVLVIHLVHQLSSFRVTAVFWNFHGSSCVLFPVPMRRNALFIFVMSILPHKYQSQISMYVYIYISYKYIYIYGILVYKRKFRQLYTVFLKYPLHSIKSGFLFYLSHKIALTMTNKE